MKLNQNHFTAALVAATAVAGFFAGQISGSNLQIVATKLINASLFTTLSLLFITFTKGTSYDIIDEIFVERNLPAAVFVGFFMYALSLVLTTVS